MAVVIIGTLIARYGYKKPWLHSVGVGFIAEVCVTLVFLFFMLMVGA